MCFSLETDLVSILRTELNSTEQNGLQKFLQVSGLCFVMYFKSNNSQIH